MWLKRIRTVLICVSVFIGVNSPAFWAGQYTSKQEYKETIKNLQGTIDYQTESYNRAMRDQRDNLLAEKNQEIDRNRAASNQEIGRLMNMCTAAATKANQVLDTVKESREAQVEAIKETMEKTK